MIEVIIMSGYEDLILKYPKYLQQCIEFVTLKLNVFFEIECVHFTLLSL